jgi:outer membrane protein TolC
MKKSSYIAHQVDVDKAMLQVADKQDRVRQTQAAFDAATIRVAYSMGQPLDAMLIPDTTEAYTSLTEGAEERLSPITFDSTRTGKIYTTLYQRDSLSIERAAENVLPSLSAYGGIGFAEGGGSFTENTRIMAGVDFSFPFKKEREKAYVELARIDQRKIALESRSTRGAITMRFTQLRSSIVFQKEAIELAEKRLELAQSILKAEQEDYLYGRTSLNYLIQALNTLQSNRLLITEARLDLARLRLETLELYDQLITETEIDNLRKKTVIKDK